MISKSNSSSSPAKTSKPSSSKASSVKSSTSAAPKASKSQSQATSKPKESVKVSAESKQPESASPVNFGAWGNSLLKQGSSGDGVKALQQSLNDKMGGSLKVDGKFGKDTQAAVRQFQEKNHLKADGLAGSDTKGALTGNAPAKTQADPKAAGADPKAAGADPKAAGAKKIGGIQDTSWKDKLPDGLKDHAQEFIDAGKKYNVDPRFLASISMQETGGGKSSAFRNKNNAMGISGSGGPKRFESVGASIDSMARGLAKPDGYYQGKGTISQIGGVYAPIGAKNDPNGLNRHWVPNISKNFRSLGGDPTADVK